VHLDVDLVLTGRDGQPRGCAGQHLAVELHVVLALGIQLDLLGLGQVIYPVKVHQHVVVVLTPERREEGAALGAAVLHVVAQPDLVIAGIPDPGGLFLGHGRRRAQKGKHQPGQQCQPPGVIKHMSHNSN
jgi:hypothetical protein